MDIKLENVEDLLRKYEAEILQKLGELIAIPSISSDLPMVKKALKCSLNLGETLGFRSKAELEESVGVIEMGEGDETVGILVHVDVVPPGEISLWESDPFKMLEKDGKLYGRGTLDDKGALVASLYAMKIATDISKESGLPIKKKVQLIIGTQEEVAWTDMERYVKEFDLPDYGFTPDGEFPLCNIEKGIADFIIKFPYDSDYSNPGSQASSAAVISIDGGHALNAVPGKCTYKVKSDHGEETVEIQGKTVHSCQPERGENAITGAVKQILSKGYESNNVYRVCEFVDKYFSSMKGEELGLCSESEYYNGEFVHRNVFTPTTIKTEKDGILLGVNSRIAYGTDMEQVFEAFEKAAREYGGEIIYKHSAPAIYISKEKPFLKKLAQAYESVTGKENEFVLAYGGSYAKAMPNVVSWGPIFLGEEDTCHEENEYINKESLFDNIKIFALALSNLIFKEESYK